MGGLQKLFEEDGKMGIDPTVFLTLSILWSLQTSLKTHYKTIIIERGFLSFPAKVLVILWTLSATVRRIAGIVAFFAPTLGLFNFLYQWKYEQKPFK